MADDKTVLVTFEFQGNMAEEIDKTTSKVKAMDTEAAKAFQSMTQGSSLSARGISSQSQAIDMLPGPLKSATSGFGRLIQAAKAFIATPVGLILAAIVGALKALTTWFSSSAEGQMEFAKITGYVSGALGQLKEIVLVVGKAVYNAFNDPKKAVKELWEAIKTNIVNRMQGVGEMFQALGKIISSGFTEGYDELTNASLKAATGVDNLEEKVRNYAASVHDAAMKTSELSVAEEKLSRDRSEWQKRDAELEVQMEEVRTQMYAASDQERLKLAEKYKAVVAEKYQKETEFLQEQLRIKNALNDLTTNSQADYDEVNRLEAALVRLKAQEQQALRPIARQEGSILRKQDGDPVKEAKDRLTKQKEYQKEWEKNQLDFAEKQLDLLNDSFYKQQRLSELNYIKELADIETQKEDLLKAKREAFGSTATLSDDETEYFNRLIDLAGEAYEKTANDITDSINDAFQEGRLRFADELTVQLYDIEQYYKDRLRQAAGNEKLIAALTIAKQKEITLATNAYTEEMLAYDIEITRKRMENADDFYKWETDKREALLKAEKANIEERIRLMEQQQDIAPSDQLAKEIELAKIELEKFNQELKRIPNEKLAETTNAFAQIAGALGGLEGEIGSTFSALSGSLSSISESFSRDTSTMQGKVGAISTAVSGTVTLINMVTSAAAKRKAVEKEFYKNAIAFAHEYALSLNEQVRLQSTSNAFIRNYSGEIKDNFKALGSAMSAYEESVDKLSEGRAKVDLRDTIDSNNTLKGLAVGAGVGAAVGSMILPGIGTAIGAVVGAIGGLIAGLFSKKKKTITDDLLKVFPELVDEAGNLNREMAEALISTDQLDDKTKQLLQNTLDWEAAVEAAKENLKEITTELAGDLGNNLRNAIVGAWKAGEDASEAMFATASDSLENFITQLLYSALFSDIFNEFGDRLVESLSPDGDQDILDDYDWLMDRVDERDNQYLEYLNKVKARAHERGYTTFGENKATTDKRTGTSKEIQSITQETGESINGRLTALLIYQDSINLSVGGINKSLVTGISVLREIKQDTAHLTRLENIENNIGSMKNALNTVNDRGVFIRTA